MPNYRRNRAPGATYFFTVNLYDRASNLLVTEIAPLRTAVRAARAAHPFHIDAWVVLPEHMHCLWTLPAEDSDFPVRWQAIKAGFTRLLPVHDKKIWQRGYWEHTIRDERDYTVHMDYIHFNPVKHGLTGTPADWPHSTFARCVRQGLYPAAWLPAEPVIPRVGERAER